MPHPSSPFAGSSALPDDPAYGRRVMLLAFTCTMSMTLGVSSILPLLPLLTEVFSISLIQASLVITVFSLPGIVFAPVAGVLADRYGRRAVLVPSLLLFGLSGAACAAAPDFPTLVVLRFFQGMGAAPLGVINGTIIADTFSGPMLARKIGHNMSLLSVCTAAFPFLGGLAAHFHWRLSFLLPVVALPVVLIALRTSLLVPAMSSSLRAYARALGHAMAERRILLLIALTFVTFLLLYGPIITCFPALAHERFNAAPRTIGLLMVASAAGATILAAQTGRLNRLFPVAGMLAVSQVLYIASLLLLPAISSLGWLVPAMFLFGLGQGLNIPNVQTQLVQAAPPGQRAAIMAANGMLLRLGQTVSPLVFSAIAEAWGLAAGFYGGVALALVLLVLVFFYAPYVVKS